MFGKNMKWWIKILVGSGGLIVLAITIVQMICAKPPQASSVHGMVGCNVSARDIFFNENLDAEPKNKFRIFRSKSKEFVPTASVQEVFSSRDFFESGYGNLAILPKAQTRSSALKTDAFRILKPANQHKIKLSHLPVWLQFSHYSPVSNKKPRHLGIFVVTFGHMGSVMPLEVYRNKNWKRPQSKTKLGEFSEVVGLPWSEFFSFVQKYSSTDAKLADVDQVVKGPWHAVPGGGDNSSWDYREFWKWAAENCQKTAKNVLDANSDFENAKVSTRLIRFTPIAQPVSNSPVVFDIRSFSKEEGVAFVAIYSLEDSGQDIRRWYWIIDED
jgi:hypothetical protein